MSWMAPLIHKKVANSEYLVSLWSGCPRPLWIMFSCQLSGSLCFQSSSFCIESIEYLTRGRKIRDFIQDIIEAAEPPVVLITHSLGGIACVDLLIEKSLPQVTCLVTVGSQAPQYYSFSAMSTIVCKRTKLAR